MDVAIRDAGLEDVAAIAELERQLSGRYSPEFWRELLATSAYPILTFCAEGGGKVVGFLVAQVRVGEHGLASESGWLTNMGVAPEHQRAGIGSALLAAARQRLREIGVPELWGMAPAGGPVVSFPQREQFVVRRDLVTVRLDVGGPAWRPPPPAPVPARPVPHDGVGATGRGHVAALYRDSEVPGFVRLTSY